MDSLFKDNRAVTKLPLPLLRFQPVNVASSLDALITPALRVQASEEILGEVSKRHIALIKEDSKKSPSFVRALPPPARKMYRTLQKLVPRVESLQISIERISHPQDANMNSAFFPRMEGYSDTVYVIAAKKSFLAYRIDKSQGRLMMNEDVPREEKFILSASGDLIGYLVDGSPPDSPRVASFARLWIKNLFVKIVERGITL